MKVKVPNYLLPLTLIVGFTFGIIITLLQNIILGVIFAIVGARILYVKDNTKSEDSE